MSRKRSIIYRTPASFFYKQPVDQSSFNDALQKLIIEQAAAREKISELREKDATHQILLGIESKLDRLLERFEEVL